MNASQKIEKWKRWLQTIYNEVSLLVWSCNIYSETRQIVTDNLVINKHNRFYAWITRNYVHTTLMGIRRQVDNDRNTISLVNLLGDMKDNCSLLTREQHLILYSEGMNSLGNSTFDSLSGEAANVFPVTKLEKDLCDLERISDLHKSYIDRRIAHYDRVGQIQNLGTFQDLDDAVASFEQMVFRYYLLLIAEHVSLLPVPQYDWRVIFRQAWILNTGDVVGEDG